MTMQQALVDKTKLKLEEIVKLPNVAVKLSDDELDYYGRMAVEGYLADKQTRVEWESRNEKAIKLALQVTEAKTFPWTGASNVKFPLVTIAALQFLARIGILTKGQHLVKAEVWGRDPEGKKAERAARISQHMSYQLVEQDRNWIDDDEAAKLSASLLGCAIKKSHYDGVEGLNRSQFVPLMDFVVDYYCKDLEIAQRATHRLDMFQNRIEENVRRGLFLEMRDESEAPYAQLESSSNQMRATSDLAQGLTRQTQDNLRPYEILEQHCWLDLDDDGYCEPYVMFVRLDTAQVLRIVARFFDEGDVYRVHDTEIRQLEQKAQEVELPLEKSMYERQADQLEKAATNKIVRIVPTTHFTKYTFIPSPDSGFYGLGLGALLGPTNAAVDSLINQIIDAGTMLTTSGGFLGRGVKIKSGKQSFDPFEWKPVDGSGDDLRKNIVPLPVNAPNDVMFQLLGLLISYGEKIGSSTDVMTGVNPGQNTPAETSRNTLEQGMMLFSGIYARMYRAQREEFRKLYQLNRWYFKQSPQYQEMTSGEGALVAPEDYDSNTYRIFPAADATAVSSSQKQQKAKVLFEVSSAKPNGFNQYEVVKRMLEAHDIEGLEVVFPDPKGPKAIAPMPNPKIELEKAKLQQADKQHQDEMELAVATLRKDVMLSDAKIMALQAKAKKEMAEAAGVETGHQISLINAQIGAAKAHKENLMRVLENWQASQESQRKHELERAKLGAGSGKSSGNGGMGKKPSDTAVQAITD